MSLKISRLSALSFRVKLSTAAAALVIATVGAMLVPVYLSGRRAMLRATQDALESSAYALSSAVGIETLDSVAAAPDKITTASVSAKRALRQLLPPNLGDNKPNDGAEYVMIRRDGFRRLVRSTDSTWRGTDEPWTPPPGLTDSITTIVAGHRSLYVFHVGSEQLAIAPVFRDVTIPAARLRA